MSKPLKFNIKREAIKLEALEYYGMLNDEVGYISLTGFESGCAEAIRKAFLDLRDNKGAKRLVLDLRGNAGGLLDESLLREVLAWAAGADRCEAVVTGHSLPDFVAEAADYLTRFSCERHPYQRGVAAREGIEY